MHLTLCTDGIHPHALGGMQKHSRLLAEHLARTGRFQLTVIHPHAPGVFDASLGIREVSVAPIDEGRLYYRELHAYSGRVGEKLEELKPDTILSQGLSVWKGIARFSDRLIVLPHGLEMFQGLTAKDRLLTWPFRRAMRHVVRHSRVAISLGGRLTPMLRDLAHGSPCQVVVIPNAVELSAMPPASSAPPREARPNVPLNPVPSASSAPPREARPNIPLNLVPPASSAPPREVRPNIPLNLVPPASSAPPREARANAPLNLLFVGRFAFNKGLDVLLQVARKLMHEGLGDRIRFQLAGDGPLMAELRMHGVPANVEVLGRVDDARLDALYRTCDALVLPTRFEGMPTVVLEAMARAKPILVSDVGATAEQVDGANGYLLPPGDAEALYRAVRTFQALNAEQRGRMGAISLERVKERFTWEAVVNQYMDLLTVA